MRCLFWPVLMVLLFAGCQPARRYPAPATEKTQAVSEKKDEMPGDDRLLWVEPMQEVRDIPIVFVSETDPEWQGLAGFWNLSPAVGAGMPTLHLGASPLAAAAAIVAAEQMQVIKIKTPLGLPDPTPFIPSVNRPGYAAWRLGKELFFDDLLFGADTRLSCASCHQPSHGYTQDYPRFRFGTVRNTLSLINSVYNRTQFWDGRVQTLEETIWSGGGEANVAEHGWNVAKTLIDTPQLSRKYTPMFFAVYGVTRPTQDTAAKALATYMRTLLSGNSVVDLAVREQRRRKDGELTREHFAVALDDASVPVSGKSAAGVAAELERGAKIFHGRGGCARCHQGPLFTDGSFQNIGLEGSDIKQLAGQDLGRFARVPIGLKSPQLIGGYRTPTLRALPRTGPYMRDGRFASVAKVIEYFNHRIDAAHNRYVSPLLLNAVGQGERLGLDAGDIQALSEYLRALDGEAVAVP